MTLSDEQIQELLRVGNPTNEECRLIRMGWDAAMRTKSASDGWKLVPRESIEKMLTQLMDIAVSNGANSISMPDEYVEVAAWIGVIPAQPAPGEPVVTPKMEQDAES